MSNESSENVLQGTGLRRSKRTFETVEAGEAGEEEITKQASDGNAKLSDNSKRSMDELRAISRQRYLNKRQREKLEWLEKDVHILEEVVNKYGWDNLSSVEQEEVLVKRELFKLLKESSKSDTMPSFQLPVDRPKQELLSAKLQKQDDRIHWEEQQIKKAVLKSDADEIKVPGSDKYEFVFDPEALIEFTGEEDDVMNGDQGDSLTEALDQEITRLKNIQETRKSLPVYRYRDELLSAISDHQVLIVVGETGSGKTTQLPQYLVEEGYANNGKCVACTQPRRVAATSVAARVADEMDVILGKEVGYSIRFDDKTTRGKTLLKYVTDGMLLREFLNDPEMNAYSCIMIDEAHERTLATDILLGLLRGILDDRKDLKLIISSATMNATKFSKFFSDCPIFNVPGRRFPVDIHYTLQPEANYVNAAITTVFQIHTTQAVPGDILVFLTGQEEIESMRTKTLEIVSKLDSKKFPDLLVIPLYANLPQEQQARIFEPTPKNCRKVVLATNIAETSLTINGIKFVIDPGFVKEQSYMKGISQLVTIPCSQASVDQRAGRAGRLGPGKCFRLFTKWSYYHELEKMPKPEILRTKLNQVVLLLLSLGINDLINFPLLDKPSIRQLSESLENLYTIGALNSKGLITKVGRLMCDFPCDPEFAKVIHTAVSHEQCKGILSQVLTIISMLQESISVFQPQLNNQDKIKMFGTSSQHNDHMLFLWIYEQWEENGYSRRWCTDHKLQYKTMKRVLNIRSQLWKHCERLGFIAEDQMFCNKIKDEMTHRTVEMKVTKSFICGFPYNIAKISNQGYKNIKNDLPVSVHPSSLIFQKIKDEGKPAKYIFYQSLMLTSKEFVKDCISFEKYEWMHEMMPHVYK